MESSTGTWSGQGIDQQETGDLVDTGRERAKGVLGAVRKRVLAQLDQQKDRLAQKLEEVGASLEKAAEALSGDGGTPKVPIDKAERLIRQVSERIRNQSTTELLDSAEDAIRSRPYVAFAGLAALGFLAVRWVRG